MTADANEELVKVTIRLPKDLVKSGKAVAMALELDLQDLVRDALMYYIQRKAHMKALRDLGDAIIEMTDRIKRREKGDT